MRLKFNVKNEFYASMITAEQSTLIANFAINILTSAAVSALLSSALVWLGKTWISERIKGAIQSEYNEKLETHKAQLKAQSDTEIERLRAQLNLTSMEHQVRFAGLHNKRAEVIAEVYQLLVEAHWHTAAFSSPIGSANGPTKAEQYVSADGALRNFFRYFEKNRIYLPPESCAQLEELVSTMREKVHKFGIWVRMPESAIDGQRSIHMHDAWVSASDYFDKEFPVSRAALERDLRALLAGPQSF